MFFCQLNLLNINIIPLIQNWSFYRIPDPMISDRILPTIFVRRIANFLIIRTFEILQALLYCSRFSLKLSVLTK